MQLAELVVQGLFGQYTHKVPFPTTSEDETIPSVVILHGRNGIGKTTVLRMLNGMMALDFSVFRTVPFTSAHLDFNTGARMSVSRREDGVIRAEFDGLVALLHAEQSGPWRDEDSESIKSFRARFTAATESLSFEYLSTRRGHGEDVVALDPSTRRFVTQRAATKHLEIQQALLEARLERDRVQHHVSRAAELAGAVQLFIREAQLDSPAYFRSNQPDLFIRVIDDLASPAKPPMQAAEIAQSLTDVRELEVTHTRLGLGRDHWDFERVMGLLVGGETSLDERALAVLGTYTEFLESRARARQLVAERLMTFESIMDQFWLDKTLHVDAKRGFTITSRSDDGRLTENQLSSGEYQLLYLMVAALTTRRRGTVIAIDEPELSMHVGWQRMLLPSLIKCASRAAPQLIIATHSPEIAAGYPQSMIELSGTVTTNAEA